MKCTACNKELSKKDVLYTEDRLPYCANPFVCNDHHPNSVPNIVKRGGAVEMYNESDLEVTLYNKLDVSDEMRDRIDKIATKPQSIRLSKIDIAYYLIRLQESMGFASLSETIRFCVTETSKHYPIDGVSHAEEVKHVQEHEVSEVVEHEPVKEVEHPQEEEMLF